MAASKSVIVYWRGN